MPRNYLTYCISFLIFSFASFAYAENLDCCAKTTSTKTEKTTAISSTSEEEKKEEKEKEEEKPPKIGNFGLPNSQQIGSLISFGHYTLDKGQTQAILGGIDFVGRNEQLFDIIPGIIHQITDNLSVLLAVPIATNYRLENTHSSGLGDAIFQFEYSAYSKETATFSDDFSIITYATIPTGSIQKEPNTGLGAPSFFLGATYARTTVEWYGFLSAGGVANTSENGMKRGNQFLYQGGIGKNLHTVPSKYIFAALIEVDGTYTEKTIEQGITDPDSGGNVVYVTPSLWLSTQKLIFQLGVGFPVTQHLFGEQIPTNYLVAGSVIWTF